MNEKSMNFMRQFRSKTSSDLDNLTASQLLAIWEHYDSDGNGYIESDELDHFLREFVTSVCKSDVGQEAISPTIYKELKQDFLDAYDENGDGRIEIRELAQLLPVDENFLLVFNLDNRMKSSVDFMKIWKKYDSDTSGYIEGDELKNFMKDLMSQAHPDGEGMHPEKLEEYCTAILRIFDANNDGKLELTEMARLLPIKENVLKDTFSSDVLKGSHPVTYIEIKKVFDAYDKDGSGVLESEEIQGFARDLLDMMKPEYTSADLTGFHSMLMSSCDLDGDGQICQEELTMMLLGIQKLAK